MKGCSFIIEVAIFFAMLHRIIKVQECDARMYNEGKMLGTKNKYHVSNKGDRVL